LGDLKTKHPSREGGRRGMIVDLGIAIVTALSEPTSPFNLISNPVTTRM
jgi:hypothetical protein